MAQWIRRLPTEQEIPGSSPGKVNFLAFWDATCDKSSTTILGRWWRPNYTLGSAILLAEKFFLTYNRARLEISRIIFPFFIWLTLLKEAYAISSLRACLLSCCCFSSCLSFSSPQFLLKSAVCECALHLATAQWRYISVSYWLTELHTHRLKERSGHLLFPCATILKRNQIAILYWLCAEPGECLFVLPFVFTSEFVIW